MGNPELLNGSQPLELKIKCRLNETGPQVKLTIWAALHPESYLCI